jgi:two-component system sensor kinase FixL
MIDKAPRMPAGALKRINITEELKPPPEWPSFLDALFETRRSRIFLVSGVLVLLIAFADSLTRVNASLGVLYVFPIAVGAAGLQRWQMIALVALCAVLREHLGPFSWTDLAASRLLSSFVAFAGMGLLLNEIARNRRMTLRHYRELGDQIAKRQEMENRLSSLVESSPAAIVTLDSTGTILMANDAAESLLAAGSGPLEGNSIRPFVPTLADILAETGSGLPYRTATTCPGRRANGESFLASVWFATYPTRGGVHLAAIIADASEDLRDFQESSLQSLLKSTRVLVGSVSHEVRNMCAAIAVVHANLRRIPGVAESEDYVALGTLAEGLTRLATSEMQTQSELAAEAVDLHTLLDEFRIVLDPSLAENGIDLEVHVPPDTPPVSGDRHSLLQVLLNLARNSIRALQGCEVRRLSIWVCPAESHVLLRFSDTGPGIKNPDKLFQAFQRGADVVGLGLFTSRALARACGGELYHEPSAQGCTMCIRLQNWTGQETPGDLSVSEMHA